jgi:hypothetical protein
MAAQQGSATQLVQKDRLLEIARAEQRVRRVHEARRMC